MKKLGIILAYFLSFSIFAQDIQLSEFYSAPLYMNPAMAGAAHHYRGVVHNRMQWLGFDSRYTSNMFSFDKYFNHYKSGVGIMFLRDQQGQAGPTITSNQVSLHYAYELHLNNMYTIRYGLSAGYIFRRLGGDLIFNDQFSTTSKGIVGPSNDAGIARNRNYIDIGSGAVLYSHNYWVSAALHHMNQPNTAFDGSLKYPMKFSMQVGYKIALFHPKHMAYLEPEKDISITPTAQYRAQGRNDQVDLGIYGIYDQLITGVWYRGIPFKKEPDFNNHESVVFTIGWRYDSYNISYSYDALIGSHAGTGRGAHELNLTFVQHKHHHAKKPMKKIPCPSFYK